MKKVLVFGTYDIFHKGHEFFLNKAKEFGDLTIVVARDKTVLDVKGRECINSEEERVAKLKEKGFNARLGGLGDKYKVIEEIKPDFICLGYDQDSMNLEEELKKRMLKIKIIRIKESFQPEKYKSSVLRKNII